MLDKTRTNGPKVRPKPAPLRTHEELAKAHERMARRVDYHAMVEQDIGLLAMRMYEYARDHYMETFGSKKSHRLPTGEIGFKAIPGRISRGEVPRDDYHKTLKAVGLGDCIVKEPTVDESMLGERLAADPELLKKLKEKLPTFAMGEGYNQFWIDFTGRDQRVSGNPARREFAIGIPESRKKKKAATAA